MNPRLTDAERAALPEAWRDLLEGLDILARKASADWGGPFVCKHDELTVCVDPADFTAEELDRLDELGFSPNKDDDTFYSFRFGSA